MARTGTGWMIALMVMVVGVAAAGDAQAQGLDFFPVDSESTTTESSSEDDEAFRQGLSDLRQRSGDDGSNGTRETDAPRDEAQRSSASPGVGGGPVSALKPVDAVPQGQALEPSLYSAFSAAELKPWEVCAGNVFISHGGQGSVIDVRGEGLAQIDSPNWSSCVNDVLAVGSDAHHLSAFDAQRQDWRHARLDTPSGVAITDVQVQEVEDSRRAGGAFLVDVRTGGEDRFLGVWEPGQVDVELQPTPFAGLVQARDLGDRLRVVWVDYSENRQGERVVSDMKQSGVQTLHRQIGGEVDILDDGWVVSRGGSSGHIVTPAGQVRKWEIQGCGGRARLWRTYPEPAAALMSCPSDQDGVERFKYWTPRDSQVWQMERDYERTSTQNQTLMDVDQPVASRVGPDRDVGEGLWFDMIHGTMWRGQALLSAYRWNGEGVARTFLATNVALGEETTSAERDLYLIDSQAGTEQPVAVYGDCPGFLRAVDQVEAAVIIQCVSQDPGGAYRFKYHWSEFIDLRSGDWWRTSSREIRKFGPQGRLIVTDRSEGADYHWTMGSRLYFTEPVVDAR